MESPNNELVLLKIFGTPLFMPVCIDSDAYQSTHLLDVIEKGFYFDYDSYDGFEVKKLYPQFGAQEVTERLVDLGIGNFDVEGSYDENYQQLPLRLEIRIGNLG